MTLRLSLSRPAVGGVQRSVHARRPATLLGDEPVGYGSVDGTDADRRRDARDGRHDHRRSAGAPGSGADRLRHAPRRRRRVWRSRFGPCLHTPPPDVPTELTAEPVADPKHSHQWGHLHFVVPAKPAGRIAQVRGARQHEPNPIARRRRHVLHPGPARPGGDLEDGGADGPGGRARRAAPVDVDFGGLDRVDALLGRRARRRQLQPGRAARGRRADHDARSTTRSCRRSTRQGQCFIATAAWGSALEPTVAAMRHARDRLLADVPLFAVAADLYGRSGPAAASVLKRSDTARVLARQLLGPLGTTAEARRHPRLRSRAKPKLGVDNRRATPIIPPSCARGLPALGANARKDEVFREQCPPSTSS